MITTNPILLDGKNTAFGGRIIDASLNIEFSAASSFSISVVSESGTYSIDATSLRAGGNPMVLKVGDKEFKIFPVAYTVENSEGVKTLRVEFLDSSVKHLDKKFVLLKGTHITADNINNPDVDMSWIIPLGTPYEVRNSDAGETLLPIGDVVDDNGYVVNGYGVFSQDVVVYYSLMSLLNALGTLIDETEKQKVRAVLSKLYSDQYNDGLGFVSKTREKDFVGTVREVLSSWSEEIGLIFYWDPVDEKIKTLDPNDPIDATEVATAVERMGECSCKSSSVTRSIQNNILEGNIIIGSDDVVSHADGGEGGSRQRRGQSGFLPLNIWDSIGIRSYNPILASTIGAEDVADGAFVSGLNKLIKAASIGEDFYLGYVIRCLVPTGTNVFSSRTTDVERNVAVEMLYGNGLDVEPYGISISGVSAIPNENSVQAVIDGIKGGDPDYINNNNPVLIYLCTNKMLKEAENPEDGGAVKGGRDALESLFDNTSDERIFKSLKELSQNYNRWYYSKKLITNAKFSARDYEAQASWVFHNLDAYDSPLASLIAAKDANLSSPALEEVAKSETNVPIKGEAANWTLEIPKAKDVVNPSGLFNCADGGDITQTGEELEKCSHYSLRGTMARVNICEFVYSEAQMGKITALFSHNGFEGTGPYAEFAAFVDDYNNLQTIRSAYNISSNIDYGVVLIDRLGGGRDSYTFNGGGVTAPAVKEMSNNATRTAMNLQAAGKKIIYTRGKFDFDAALRGGAVLIKEGMTEQEASDIYREEELFSFTYSNPAGGGDGDDDDDEGIGMSFFAKGVYVPDDSNSYVQGNVSTQSLSFVELISTAGKRVKRSIDLSDIKAFASNWAKKLSINDPEPQYSQQISFVGIPESIPSIAEGLEGLSISVDENGVSTQVSVGSRKIKREIFEKRQRMISEAKYRSERSRLTLIPNGRFSTRFLAGTQL